MAKLFSCLEQSCMIHLNYPLVWFLSCAVLDSFPDTVGEHWLTQTKAVLGAVVTV